MTIELRFFAGCPHVDDTRALVQGCLARLGLDLPVEEREGDFPSPSVLVDGRDVMGAAESNERSCRLDLPTAAAVMSALRAALKEQG